MKFLFILCLASILLPIHAQPRAEGKCNNEKTIFWTDTLYLKNYSIIQSGINGQFFLIPNSTYVSHHKKYKFWNDSNVIIYTELVDQIYFQCCIRNNLAYNDSVWKEIWPWKEMPKSFIVPIQCANDTICECLIDSCPTFFRVFQIRGDVYNKLSNCLDCGSKPIKFRYPKKYYTVYCPIR